MVADGEVAPVRQKRFGVRAEEASEVRRVLERGVEVDVVGHFEGKVRARGVEGDEIGTARHELVDARECVLPGRAAEREKRVERRRLEHRPEAGRGEVEHSLGDAEADARSVRADRKDPEADGTSHDGSIPSATSSSTGSKKLQLPIEWSSSRRMRASSSADAERSRQASDSASSAKTDGSISASAALLLAREDDCSEKVEKPVLTVRAHGVMEACRRLEHEAALATGADKVGERGGSRHRRAAAPDLRAQPKLGDAVEPILETVVERRLDVHLSLRKRRHRPPPDRRRAEPRPPRPGIRSESGASSTALMARSVAGSSSERDAGHTSRASMNACALATARASSASASSAGSDAGGNVGAWSIRRASSAWRASPSGMGAPIFAEAVSSRFRECPMRVEAACPTLPPSSRPLGPI